MTASVLLLDDGMLGLTTAGVFVLRDDNDGRDQSSSFILGTKDNRQAGPG
jgi:hypothetical protein